MVRPNAGNALSMANDAGDDDRESVLELEALPKTVAEVMTRKVVTVKPSDTLRQAREGMQQFRFRHLPVVDESRKLIGLVTRADVLHASSSFLSDAAEERDKVILQQPVEKIMQTEIITAGPKDTLLSAARLMSETHFGCLPIVTAENELVGILTEADFVKLTIKLLNHGQRPPPPSMAKR